MVRRIAAACLVVIPLLLTACADQNKKPQPTEEPYVGGGKMDNMNQPGGSGAPRTNDPGANPGANDPGYANNETVAPANKPPAHAKPKSSSAAKPKASASKSRSYVVQKGDTLSEIAEKFYKDSSKWKTIYNANKSKIADPKKLKVGTKLVIP